MFSYAEIPERGLKVRVLCYNIHRCFGTDRRYDPGRVLEVLRAANADVIALQEVDSSLEVIDGVDQLSFFANELKVRAVMGPTLKRGYGAYGNAFLSRFPFFSISEADLTYRRFEPRGLLAASLNMDGHRLRMVNTHLGLKAWERRFQLDRLMDSVDWSLNVPTLVMGDFNEWLPWSRNTRKLSQHFGPTPRLRTFPAQWPRLCLDRVYASPVPRRFHLETVAGDSARCASDHLPLVADVEF